MNKGRYRITDIRREYFADSADEAVEISHKCNSDFDISEWKYCPLWDKERYVTAHIPTVRALAREEREVSA